MKSKRLNLILFLVLIIFGNSIFVYESSAFIYSNPSTTPLWSYSTGKQFVSAVDISSDGTYITAASENSVYNVDIKANGTLYLFNNSYSKNKSPLWNYSIVNDFYSLAISGNGSHIIAGGGSSERIAYLFNNSKPTPEWTSSIGGWVYGVAISDDGDYTVIAGGHIKRVFLFNTTESLPIKEYSTTGLTLRVAISANGSFMAAMDSDAKLYFFNTSKNSHDWAFTLVNYISTSLSMSADGNDIAVGGDRVYLFRKQSSIPLWTYDTPDEVSSIKISQDGNYIVAGGDYTDHNVYLFNRNDSIPEWIYSTGDRVISVAISNNGDYIVAQSGNSWIYLFNKSSSIPIWRYRLAGSPTISPDFTLAISSDGKYIVAGGRHHFYLFDRDTIIAPKLIIPGYNLFFMFLMIGIMLLSCGIVVLKHKKIQRNPFN